jgi:hypothetical protein
MSSLRLERIANPAAGALFFYTQPANLRSKIRICRFTYTASAAVASRNMELLALTGAVIFAGVRWIQDTAAGLVRHYIALDQWPQAEMVMWPGATSAVVRESGGFWLLPAMTFQCSVAGIDVADQISDIYILFEDMNLVSPGIVG